ncbi:spermidine/putrescine ABC transporter substrate-binding protein [Candidatus Poribacteria bacterium]|nr:spermidine/putrescine ABC transporter substrate-binding protein [Candidatus Poribacteria bacterium]
MDDSSEQPSNQSEQFIAYRAQVHCSPDQAIERLTINRPMTRRGFLKSASRLGAVMIFSAPVIWGTTSCAKKQQLFVYNWSDYIGETTIADFEKEFDVKVTYDNYSTNEELLAKLQAGATGYDIIVPSDYTVELMVKRSLLAELNFANIPNFQNIASRFKNLPFDLGNKYSVPYLWGTTGIGVNTEKVTEPVDSWSILWDEKYKERISMLDDMRGLADCALKYLGYSVNTTDARQIEEARQLLLKQKPLVKVYTSETYMDFLKSGDIWIAHAYSGDVYQVAKENKAIKYVIPKEGTEISVESLCIPKGAPHKDTAERFINYLLRPKVSAGISNFTWYANPNEASHPFTNPAILNDSSIYPPPDVLERCEFLRDLGHAIHLYEQLYNEVKG